MPFNRPSLTQLIERARADLDAWLPGADSRLRAAVLDVLVRMHSGGMHGLYGYLDYLSQQIIPDTADAEIMARWASIWGIQRKSANAATGNASGTGTNGTIIPAATVLVRADGARFLTNAAAVVAVGVVTVAVTALRVPVTLVLVITSAPPASCRNVLATATPLSWLPVCPAASRAPSSAAASATDRAW